VNTRVNVPEGAQLKSEKCKLIRRTSRAEERRGVTCSNRYSPHEFGVLHFRVAPRCSPEERWHEAAKNLLKFGGNHAHSPPACRVSGCPVCRTRSALRRGRRLLGAFPEGGLSWLLWSVGSVARLHRTWDNRDCAN